VHTTCAGSLLEHSAFYNGLEPSELLLKPFKALQQLGICQLGAWWAGHLLSRSVGDVMDYLNGSFTDIWDLSDLFDTGTAPLKLP
jgi:hypothetical protein